MNGEIIRVMLQRRYRKCEFLGSKGNNLDIRVLAYEQVCNVPAYQTAGFSKVHPEDQHIVLEQNPNAAKAHKITVVKKIFWPEFKAVCEAGKTFTTRALCYSGNCVEVYSPKRKAYLKFPLEAVEITVED